MDKCTKTSSSSLVWNWCLSVSKSLNLVFISILKQDVNCWVEIMHSKSFSFEEILLQLNGEYKYELWGPNFLHHLLRRWGGIHTGDNYIFSSMKTDKIWNYVTFSSYSSLEKRGSIKLEKNNKKCYWNHEKRLIHPLSWKFVKDYI